jgi:hypothetical protein
LIFEEDLIKSELLERINIGDIEECTNEEGTIDDNNRPNNHKSIQ